LISSLAKFGVNAEASGRNDLVVGGRKISGSAYKLKLGRQNGEGRRSLHHGTMLLNLELDALQKYLNPNKKKLVSKGVESVVSRVLNLQEICPTLDHHSFCESLEEQFTKKWESLPIKRSVLSEHSLKEIPQLMEIYEGYKRWEWRFGETP
jgi:lipoate-protein ligase A